MGTLFIILIIAGIFAIYDALRKINNNIMEQTEEIKRVGLEAKHSKKD
ncbi:hypothetical protein [Guptibacillus algicola]|nr:hypothetical protein [Alkalihalobacillus algicola]MCA0987248.1 hypothetical protein [Alkalihalobacillus algicola]